MRVFAVIFLLACLPCSATTYFYDQHAQVAYDSQIGQAVKVSAGAQWQDGKLVRLDTSCSFYVWTFGTVIANGYVEFLGSGGSVNPICQVLQEGGDVCLTIGRILDSPDEFGRSVVVDSYRLGACQ